MELYHLKIYIDDLLHRAVAPAGILKSKMAFDGVPTFVTLAFVPGSVVVVLPTVIVAPAGPVGPVPR